MVPSSKAYSSTEDYAKANPLAAQFFEYQTTLYGPPVGDPAIPELGTLSTTLTNTAQDMFVSGKPAKEALDAAGKEMKAALE
jgi:ABC-type glycerol-3-phosphate transport system substrate-binding protein